MSNYVIPVTPPVSIVEPSMTHIDLFEVPGGLLYLVPDVGDTIYVVDPDAYHLFSYQARLLIDNENDYRSCWPNTVLKSVGTYVDQLSHKRCKHIADFSLVHKDESLGLTEYAIHTYINVSGYLMDAPRKYVGGLVAHFSLGVYPLHDERCRRCLSVRQTIGLMDIVYHGDYVNSVSVYQCPDCGQYTQSGDVTWGCNTLAYVTWVRLQPDPYVRNGRLHMIYNGFERIFNLDGEMLSIGQDFELYYNGEYVRGSLAYDYGRFFFESDRIVEPVVLYPGLQARFPL